MYGYVSVADLSSSVRSHLYRVPADVDLIVGVPRSGMIPAYLLGLYLNRMVVDIDSFLANGAARHGLTRQLAKTLVELHDAKHILLVDDSMATGTSMRTAAERIRQTSFAGKVSICAAIVAPSQHASVDVSFLTVPHPRIFEWNAFHHACVENSCFDLDGVLCVDPTEQDNDDGARYRQFLETARPLFAPTQRIAHIVSARLEKYRSMTEEWLEAHGIEYGALHLVDLPSKEERIRHGAHCAHKIRVYRDSGAALFYESDPGQAREIANGSGKPVLCVGDMTMVLPGALHIRATAKSALWRMRAPLGRAKGWLRQQMRARRPVYRSADTP
jgi:uncharacterized HAD superfamily protein/adenine/guanine phosphoribosyltransferase-like PRPP-binding protein